VTFPLKISEGLFKNMVETVPEEDRKIWGAEGLYTILIDYVIEIAEKKARRMHGDNEEMIVETVGRLTDPLFVDSEGRHILLNYERLVEFLRKYTEVR